MRTMGILKETPYMSTEFVYLIQLLHTANALDIAISRALYQLHHEQGAVRRAIANLEAMHQETTNKPATETGQGETRNQTAAG